MISRLVSICLIVCFCFACQNENTKVQKELVAEEKSEELKIFDYDEMAPIFHQKDGKIHLINFWATWCKPCVEELPYFEKLHEHFDEDQLTVQLVSLDFPKDFDTVLKPFLEKNQLQSEVLVLDDGRANYWIDEIDPSWSGAIPASIIYKDEKREFHEKQFANFEELKILVESFLP